MNEGLGELRCRRHFLVVWYVYVQAMANILGI